MIPGMSNSAKRPILNDLVNIINLLRTGERWNTKDRSILFYLTNTNQAYHSYVFTKRNGHFENTTGMCNFYLLPGNKQVKFHKSHQITAY